MLEYSCWGWGGKSEVAHNCLIQQLNNVVKHLDFSHLCSLRIYQSHLWVNFLCAHRVAAAVPNMTAERLKQKRLPVCVSFFTSVGVGSRSYTAANSYFRGQMCVPQPALNRSGRRGRGRWARGTGHMIGLN